jgi:pSer/pThr/pTyr-binding forkhead associated (FHA) protein
MVADTGMAVEDHEVARGLVLEVLAGNASGSRIVVEDELVIGRHAQGIGGLANDIELSRQHARISREPGGGYTIEDLGSTNGTCVNDSRIESSQPLGLGDTIAVGATNILVKSLPPTTSLPSSGQQTIARPVVTAAAPAETQATLDLRLQIDFDTREATLSLQPGESFKLVLVDGRWRLEEEPMEQEPTDPEQGDSDGQ